MLGAYFFYQVWWFFRIALCAPLAERAVGVTLAIADERLSSHELMFLLLHERPPVSGEQVAQHQIHLHPGNAKTKGEYVLIAAPFVRRQVTDV